MTPEWSAYIVPLAVLVNSPYRISAMRPMQRPLDGRMLAARLERVR